MLTHLHSFDGANGEDPGGTLAEAINGSFCGTTPFGGTAKERSSKSLRLMAKEGDFQTRSVGSQPYYLES